MISFLSRNVLMLDGIGAVTSAAMLFLVLPRFEVGLPVPLLQALGLCAVFFGAYSIVCFLSGRRGSRWLKGIAILNGLYGFATASLVVLFRERMNAIGIAYFGVEIIIISGLALFEWRCANRAPQRSPL
jgi:FtsH-binding integral membrane protein